MLIANGTTPVIMFLMVDATDDETAETGLSPSAEISKNGGAFAAVTNAISEVSDGWYKVTLTATETNTNGPLVIRATGTGADEWRDIHQVTAVLPSTPPTAAAVADQVWEEAIADHSGTVGSTAEALDGATAPTAAAVADQVWEEAIADHSGTVGSTAEALDAAGGGVTAAAVADAVWEETLADHSGTAGSTAEALNNIPGASKGAIEYTYTISDGVDPIEGAEVWISTDSGGANVIWSGVSDALGVARASDNEKPWLDAGTYYGWAQLSGYSFSNPDTLTVS